MSTNKNVYRPNISKSHNYRQKSRHVTISNSREAPNDNELTVKEGDVVFVRVNPEFGWWEGEINSKSGWLPIEVSQEFKMDGGTETYEVFNIIFINVN